MKRLLAVLLVGVAVIGINPGTEASNHKTYPQVGLVISDTNRKGETWVQCQNGFKYQIKHSKEDFYKNEIVAIVLDDRGTAKAKDDKVVDHSYAGFVSKSEANRWVKH